jgi:hypothetical protein
MRSAAYLKFTGMMQGAEILSAFSGIANPACAIQSEIDQTCRKAAIANAVGCWEGYIEGVLREFVSKVRVQTHRRTWTLIAQYEGLVDKLASDLNTPNWEKTRDLILIVTGMDPYASWIWTPKFSTQNDTKQFFDGVMNVRHAFAHGFVIPNNIFGLTNPGQLDAAYVSDVFACIRFFSETTDELLEHELTHRHSCSTGWS